MENKNEMKKFFPPEEKNVDNDYKYSRDTYYELVEKGKQSLELMIEVARESEHPRAFEVLSGMIKNISDVNDRLMDLNKKKKDCLKRLHVLDDEYNLNIGIDAFIVIWRQVKYFRYLAIIADLGIIKLVLNYAYSNYANYRYKKLYKK